MNSSSIYVQRDDVNIFGIRVIDWVSLLLLLLWKWITGTTLSQSSIYWYEYIEYIYIYIILLPTQNQLFILHNIEYQSHTTTRDVEIGFNFISFHLIQFLLYFLLDDGRKFFTRSLMRDAHAVIIFQFR